MLDDLRQCPAPRWLASWLQEEHDKRRRRPRPAGTRPLPAMLAPRARGYVAGALTQAAEKLAAATARNNTLNEEVFALASRFGSAGLLEFDDVVTVMWDGAEQCGVAQEEPAKTRATLERAWRDGLAKPSSDSLPEFMFQEERPPSRHVLAPRLRVSPPAQLGEHADTVLRAQIAAVAGAMDAARPQDEDGEWPDRNQWADAVKRAGVVLGGLGDEDLIDWGAARAAIIKAASPEDLIESMTSGMDEAHATGATENYKNWLAARIEEGWNEGAEIGYEVPAELRADLDAWHPPCPIPRSEVEPHRLPPGRECRWPARNMVSKSDDRGNAERLLDHSGAGILFLDDKHLGECAFDGARWKLPDDGGPGLVRQYASETIGRLPVTEALSYSVVVWYKHTRSGEVRTTNRAEYFEWLNAQQSAGTITAMINLAKADPGHRVLPDTFDADPRWLNLPNGELDLGAAEMRNDGTWEVTAEIRFHAAHFAGHHHHRMTRAPYDPAAQCQRWRKAISDWLPDEEIRRFLQKLVGAAARGLITIKALVVLLGGGDSGKTTFLMVIAYVLGTYAITAQASILRKSRQGSLSDDLDDLKGGRLFTTAETSGGEEMDAPKIKRLSGGDTQRSRGLYSSSGEWVPRGLLFFTTNEMMYIPAADRPLWNRIRPVRFPNTFSESGTDSNGNPCRRADPNMKDRLLDEAPGILNWIIEGLQLLYTEGLAEPAAVAAERERLRGEQNTVATFLAEAGVVAVASEEPVVDDKITLTRLLRHYKQWAGAFHMPAVGRPQFRQALAGISGVSFTTSGRVETVHGIGHTSEADLYMPAEGWCQACRGKAGTGLTLTDLEELLEEQAHRPRQRSRTSVG